MLDDSGGAPTAQPDGYVQSLARGLSVIRAFDAEHPELSLSDVAKRTGLTRATARRFLQTLEALGYVRSDRRAFALRPTVLELGHAFLSSLGLPDVAMPHLEDLVRQVDESSSIAVLDGADIVYVARVAVRRIMSVNISVGTKFPAVVTAMGRVLLAGLPASDLEEKLTSADLVAHTEKTITDGAALRREIDVVRERGWEFVDQELEIGLRSIAVPVRGRDGATIAAMNISVPAFSMTADEVLANLLPPLREHADRIEADLKATKPR